MYYRWKKRVASLGEGNLQQLGNENRRPKHVPAHQPKGHRLSGRRCEASALRDITPRAGALGPATFTSRRRRGLPRHRRVALEAAVREVRAPGRTVKPYQVPADFVPD